jgi:hypothetical protein
MKNVSALDRGCDLRQQICARLKCSPFEFDLTLDSVTLDDECVLATLGINAKMTVGFVKRDIPFARLYCTDVAEQRIILDVEDPTRTRWGDLDQFFTENDSWRGQFPLPGVVKVFQDRTELSASGAWLPFRPIRLW